MKRRSSRAGGASASVVLGFLLLGVLAFWGLIRTGCYFASSVHVEHEESARGPVVKVETPVGSLRVNHRPRLDPKHLGVPVYPGARLVDSDSTAAATLEFDVDGEHGELAVAAACYSTRDSVSDVKQFYRDHLPHWLVTSHGLELTQDGYKRMVGVFRKEGETRILLASVGEPAAN